MNTTYRTCAAADGSLRGYVERRERPIRWWEVAALRGVGESRYLHLFHEVLGAGRVRACIAEQRQRMAAVQAAPVRDRAAGLAASVRTAPAAVLRLVDRLRRRLPA